MLNNATTFTSFSTSRLFETYQFYKDVLGVEVELVDNRFIHLYLTKEHPVIIYHKEDHVPARYTVLNFQITDIGSIVDELSKKGIEFLQYEEPIKTDAKGISWDKYGSHLAWFKDPGGNIVALVEN